METTSLFVTSTTGFIVNDKPPICYTLTVQVFEKARYNTEGEFTYVRKTRVLGKRYVNNFLIPHPVFTTWHD